MSAPSTTTRLRCSSSAGVKNRPCDELVVEHLGVVGRRADQPRVGVHVVELELAAVLHLGDDGVEVPGVGDQRVHVVDDERLAVARDAAGEELRGVDGQDVRAERRDLIVDALLRACAGCQHRDDGAHADDDAEHRQSRAKQVRANRLQRNDDDLAK